MNANTPPADNQHALPESTPFIVGDDDASPAVTDEATDEPTDKDEEQLLNAAEANYALLGNLSIDELRMLASKLAIPEPGTLTDSDDLIRAIRVRLRGASSAGARKVADDATK